jgi:flagellar assembly protein FliH
MISPFDRTTSHVEDLFARVDNRSVDSLVFDALALGLQSSSMIDEGGREFQASSLSADESSEPPTLAATRYTEAEMISIREEAYAFARSEFSAELASRSAAQHRLMDRARLEFARDQKRFFAAAEGQVVRLALAIATQVLAREVRGDGLHLAEAVRAALLRVHGSTETSLKVPVSEVEAWSACVESELLGKVTVVGDPHVEQGDCILETSVGRIEFGVPIQLEEIERSFAHRLEEKDTGER